jgi:hypothetical protein
MPKYYFILTGTFSRRWPAITSVTTGEGEGRLTEGPVAQDVLEANEASLQLIRGEISKFLRAPVTHNGTDRIM